jgi:UDP-N-acetyl-D-glucosamine dehydrogenase
VPVIRPSREHAKFEGKRSVPLTAKNISAADVVLVATAHDAVDWRLVARHARLVVDTRNALDGLLRGRANYFKA